MRASWILLLASWCATAQQPSYPSEPNWQRVCAEAKAQPLATHLADGPLPAAALPKCDETALYYGAGSKPNDAAALQCGWYQRSHPQPTNGNMFYGPGVLTMLYANGRGVPRNYDMAIRFACEDTWAAPAEMDGRIGHLEALRTAVADGKPAAKFDLCDDITSGLSMGFCTRVQTDAREVKRAQSIQAAVAQLPPAARADFPALQQAELAFDHARSGNEIDLSGTARGMFALEEEARLQDQFLINLQRFAKGDIPAASTAELSALQMRQEQALHTLSQQPASFYAQQGTISADGIRKTQMAWTALEAAWTRFAALAYPRLSPERVRAQLIRLRLHQLRSLAPAT